MKARLPTRLTKGKIKILLTEFTERQEREKASALTKIISLVEGYKRTEREYLSTTKAKIGALLNGYKEVSHLTINRLDSLIQGFKDKEKEYVEKRLPLFKNLLNGYFETLRRLRESQRTTAEEINILDVLGFTYDELRHSKFLAYLFDPLETHAQGNLFFKIFLKELGLPEDYTQIDYKVKTEETGDESRIDIEIMSKTRGEKGFMIHIENKVGDAPKRKQIERESRDLLIKADAMGIPKNCRHGYLLSVKNEVNLDGTQFKWIGWGKIAKCLETFIREAKAERARWVAEQYLECIEKHILKEITKEEEVKNEETE
ncbi:MAG: PD-(D/E)XK nuclease family protein [candidate division WOR-3 bacterium]